MVRILALVVVLGMGGCGKSEGGKVVPPPGANKGGQLAETKAAPKAELEPKTVAEKPVSLPPLPAIDDISKLDLAPVATKATARAKKLAKQARALNKAGDPGGAAKAYIEALAKDPGHITARYNLSCALNMSGHPERGMAVLKQFKEEGSRVSRGRLVHATSDGEWKSQHDNPQFVQLTSDVVIEALDLKAAAETIRSEVKSRKFEKVAEFLHPHAGVKIEEQYYECMHYGEDCDEASTEKKVVRGLGELTAWVRDRSAFAKKEQERLVVPKEVECSDTCCSFGGPRKGNDIPENLRVIEVCFKTDSGGVTTLSTIVLRRYEWGS